MVVSAVEGYLNMFMALLSLVEELGGVVEVVLLLLVVGVLLWVLLLVLWLLRTEERKALPEALLWGDRLSSRGCAATIAAAWDRISLVGVAGRAGGSMAVGEDVVVGVGEVEGVPPPLPPPPPPLPPTPCCGGGLER